MDSRQFWNAVNRELDAGRDPLDRRALAGWLGEHPEELEMFADLRAGLAVVSASSESAAMSRRRIGWRLLAAVALPAAALLLARSEVASPPDDGGVAAATVRVHRLVVTVESDGRLQSAESRPGWHGTLDSLPSMGSGPLLRLSVRTEEEHTVEEP